MTRSDGSLTCGALRVDFVRRGDRYAHRIVELGAAGETLLAESIEGEPDDRWPPSPPLQSLHIEEQPGLGRVALLVGMAGNSHWSLSVTAAPGGGFRFDAACRARGPAGFLGSRYRVASPALAARASAGARVEIAMNDSGTAEPISVVVRPVESGPGDAPGTARWMYEWR